MKAFYSLKELTNVRKCVYFRSVREKFKRSKYNKTYLADPYTGNSKTLNRIFFLN